MAMTTDRPVAPSPSKTPPSRRGTGTGLQVNCRTCRASVESWVTLLDLLRACADLTGVKKCCDHGRCGTRAVRYTDLVCDAGETLVEVEETAQPGAGDLLSMLRNTRNSHSAIFAGVKVDEELGVVRVTRIVMAAAAGKIIHPQPARSQILGGVVMGIGMALHEETLTDHRFGRFMNHSFDEHHVPAHADIESIEVLFVDEPDPDLTPLGIKGPGQTGIVGTAAVVANAIFHASGRRVRARPVTIDKLL